MKVDYCSRCDEALPECDCVLKDRMLAGLESENERLKLQVDFLKKYYNPQDTSFRAMMETFATLEPEQKDKLINLSKSLAEMKE